MKTPRSFSAISSQVLASNVSSMMTPSTPGKGSRERILRRTSKNRMSSIGSSISEDPRANYEDILGDESGKVSIYNCLKIHMFNKDLAERYQLSMKTVAGNCFVNAGIAHQLRLTGPAQAWANLFGVTRALWEKTGSLCTECGMEPRDCGCPWDDSRECHEARRIGKSGHEEDFMPWAVLVGR